MTRRKKAAGSSGASATRIMPEGRRFKPGQSGNPEGRPKTDPELVEAFRGRTWKALATLDKVMDDYAAERVTEKGDPLVPSQAAVKASEVVLNRGWGTAPQTVKLDATINATQAITHSVALPAPDPQRLQRVAAVLQKAGVLDALNQAVQPELEAVTTESADVRTDEEPTP